MNKKIYFVGPTLNCRNNRGGATIKNENLINYFKKNKINLKIIDTDDWKRRFPIILFNLLKMFFSPNSNKIILSTSSGGTYSFLKLSYFLNIFNKKILYFVVGGDTPLKLESGIYKKKYYMKVDKIYIETSKMKKRLEDLKIKNVEVVKNFKEFNFRQFKERKYDKPLKAVFFARIEPEKGVDMIFEMLRELNREQIKMKVDFYGPLVEKYSDIFKDKVQSVKGSEYLGILTEEKGCIYKRLEEYDIMLFPTKYYTEGIPGTIIDALIAGLPIVSAKWENYEEILNENLGYSFELGNQKEFNILVQELVDNSKKLKTISENCYKESNKYHIKNVLRKILENLI